MTGSGNCTVHAAVKGTRASFIEEGFAVMVREVPDELYIADENSLDALWK